MRRRRRGHLTGVAMALSRGALRGRPGRPGRRTAPRGRSAARRRPPAAWPPTGGRLGVVAVDRRQHLAPGAAARHQPRPRDLGGGLSPNRQRTRRARSLSSSSDRSSRSRPWCTIAMRSATRSTSDRMWLENSTVAPRPRPATAPRRGTRGARPRPGWPPARRAPADPAAGRRQHQRDRALLPERELASWIALGSMPKRAAAPLERAVPVRVERRAEPQELATVARGTARPAAWKPIRCSIATASASDRARARAPGRWRAPAGRPGSGAPSSCRPRCARGGRPRSPSGCQG